MKNGLKIFILGLLGGIVANVLFIATPLQAALQNAKYGTMTVVNNQGQRVGVIAPNESGEGALFLFSHDGKTTVQMGAYPGDGEKAQSLIGLNDKFNQLRLLMRLHSKNDSPTIILKDRYGVDKIVIGLRGDGQTPYFEYKDNNGAIVNLLDR